MAELTAFGATKIAEDVKDRIVELLKDDDWGMRYSNSDHGFVFKRTMDWDGKTTVAGGDKEGEIVVTVSRYGQTDSTVTFRGKAAVEDTAKYVMNVTRR